jgi:hypothetical protein
MELERRDHLQKLHGPWILGRRETEQTNQQTNLDDL